MERPSLDEAEREFELARRALGEADYEAALSHLEKALALHDNPSWYSFAGVCIAKGRGEFRTGVDLCLASIGQDGENPLHYLNLAKVYLAAGNKEQALRALREGMARGGSAEMLSLLIEFGTRSPPVFRSLKRSHPLNKYFGILLHRRALKRRGLP